MFAPTLPNQGQASLWAFIVIRWQTMAGFPAYSLGRDMGFFLAGELLYLRRDPLSPELLLARGLLPEDGSNRGRPLFWAWAWKGTLQDFWIRKDRLSWWRCSLRVQLQNVRTLQNLFKIFHDSLDSSSGCFGIRWAIPERVGSIALIFASDFIIRIMNNSSIIWIIIRIIKKKTKHF